MKTTSIIIFLFTSLLLNAQVSENKKLDKLIQKIEEQDFLIVDYKFTSKSIKTANKLNKLATDEELEILATKPCKLCFSYAFWVLSKRQSKLTETLYKNYQPKTSTLISTFKKDTGCIKIQMDESEFINSIYQNKMYLEELN